MRFKLLVFSSFFNLYTPFAFRISRPLFRLCTVTTMSQDARFISSGSAGNQPARPKTGDSQHRRPQSNNVPTVSASGSESADRNRRRRNGPQPGGRIVQVSQDDASDGRQLKSPKLNEKSAPQRSVEAVSSIPRASVASAVPKDSGSAAHAGAVEAPAQARPFTPSASGISVSSESSKKRNRNKGAKKPHSIDSSAVSAVKSGSSVSREPVQMECDEDAKEVILNETVAAAYMTTNRFSDLSISPQSKRAIAEVLKYQYLTHVQSQVIPPIQTGSDCLAKSKTGTGKTLAFLIPAIESVIGQSRGMSRGVSILVLSPTRELAIQIAAEARALLTFHTDSRVEIIVGGTNINSDKRRLASGPITVLVATPGRLIDHLENNPEIIGPILTGLRVVILDEADRLLDMGFKPSIDKIIRHLPDKRTRQTLLFSATIPKGVLQIADDALRPNYAMVDTTGLSNDESGNTHLHVHQELAVVPLEDTVPAIAAVIQSHIAENPNDYKIIIFFTTARVTGFMAEIFTETGLSVVEMHSRKSQGYRNTASQKFRVGKKIVMFSSDVSARGMDYPDVTFVLQVGITDKEQYIHRLGRTARAGKEGKGMIMLNPFEDRFMTHELRELPLHRISSSSLRIEEFRGTSRELLTRCHRNVEITKSAQQAYIAWLGFYNSCLKRVDWDKPTLVQNANRFAQIIGLQEQPAILKKTVGKMGLKGVPGLKLE